MHITDLQNKKIGILGFGVEGKAVANFLRAKNLPFAVLDQDASKESEVKAAGAEKYISGEEYLTHTSEFEVLFRSPGIRIFEPELVSAKEKGVKITSQIKFFMENCPAKIIGVTGTKGKGTTSKLIYEMLLKAGLTAHIGGNYGVEVLPLLDTLKPEDFVVLELSSFQLQDLETSPYIAVVLMVVPEHLNYHADIDEYIDAKATITEFQTSTDFAVINSDFENSMRIGKKGKAKKVFIQTLREDGINGSDPFKVYVAEEHLKIKDGVFAEQLHGNIYFVDHGDMRMVMSVSDVPLRGFHNIQNVSAAIAVGRILELKETDMIDAVKEFKPLPHRLEFVGEVNSIKFYNDSIGTTPESSVSAIEAFHEPVLAILGGVKKLSDYSEFAKDLARIKNLKAVSLIGELAEDLEKQLSSEGFAGKVFNGAKNMSEVFAQLTGEIKNGDVVLLAPGSSSFDMFKDYKERGEQFRVAASKYIEENK